MSERALITGAAGFVAGHLAHYLAGQGLEVHGLARPGRSLPPDRPGSWHSGDVIAPDDVRSIIGEIEPDYVFHLAALIKSDSLERLLAVNVIGTNNVLDAVAEVRPEARVLVTGSSAEYGLANADELPIREENPLRPLTRYGVSKAAQSLLAAEHARRSGLSIVRSRTFNLTGPGEPDTLACSAFARRLAAAEEAPASRRVTVGNLDSIRDFVDVRDAVRAYWLLAVRGRPGEAYNVCSGRGVRMREVLDILLRSVSDEIEIVMSADGPEPADVSIQYGDAGKLRAATGWAPATPLEESLADLIAFWRDELSRREGSE